MCPSWGSPEWTASPIRLGALRTRSGQLLPFFVPGLGGVGEARLHQPPIPPRALPGHTTHLVGEEPIPLVLLGSRAVHPLEGCVLDEDRQRAEDEGCKQV